MGASDDNPDNNHMADEDIMAHSIVRRAQLNKDHIKNIKHFSATESKLHHLFGLLQESNIQRYIN